MSLVITLMALQIGGCSRPRLEAARPRAGDEPPRLRSIVDVNQPTTLEAVTAASSDPDLIQCRLARSTSPRLRQGDRIWRKKLRQTTFESLRCRGECRLLPPPARVARGGEGSGVGGASANSPSAMGASGATPPPPTPPRRCAGGGEKNAPGMRREKAAPAVLRQINLTMLR